MPWARCSETVADPPAIELRGLSRHFGERTALQEISVSVPAGTTLAVLGRNGAGKSTLMKLIAGEIKSDTGQIFRQPGAHFARLVQEIEFAKTGGAVAFRISRRVVGVIAVRPVRPDVVQHRAQDAHRQPVQHVQLRLGEFPIGGP